MGNNISTFSFLVADQKPFALNWSLYGWSVQYPLEPDKLLMKSKVEFGVTIEPEYITMENQIEPYSVTERKLKREVHVKKEPEVDVYVKCEPDADICTKIEPEANIDIKMELENDLERESEFSVKTKVGDLMVRL